MRLIALALLFLAAPVARADWQILPAAAWVNDSTVSVAYEIHENSATGPIVGVGVTIAPPPPWSLTAPRTVSDAPFVGTGRNLVLVAKAIRGSVQSVQAVAPVFSFPLDPPVVSHN